MDKDNQIRDGVVTAAGKVVGLLAPSTIIGSDQKRTYVNSKYGIASFPTGDAEEFWKALIKSGAVLFGTVDEVKSCLSSLLDPRLSRNFSYWSTESSNCAQLIDKATRVSRSHVVIIGCGGIGSLSAMILAGANIETLTLIDPDFIEESNLNRQFFWTTNDIGLKKVEVLRDAVATRYPDTKVVISSLNHNFDELLSFANDHDACIVTADEPLGLGAELSAASNRFVVCGSYFHGYSSYSAQISPPNMKSAKIKWLRCPGFIAPSFGPANAEIASVLSSICLNYLASRNLPASMALQKAWRSNRFAAMTI